METSKKRVSIQLPIDPKAFKPIKDAIKDQGRDLGFEALVCLRERFLVKDVRADERIRHDVQTPAAKPATTKGSTP